MVTRQIMLIFLHVEPVSEIPEVLHVFWAFIIIFFGGVKYCSPYSSVSQTLDIVGKPYLFGTHLSFSTSQELFFFFFKESCRSSCAVLPK